MHQSCMVAILPEREPDPRESARIENVRKGFIKSVLFSLTVSFSVISWCKVVGRKSPAKDRHLNVLRDHWKK